MDFEKLIKFVESYGGGYFFYLIDLFRSGMDGEVLTLSRTDPRLLSFAVVSALLGGALYASAVGAAADEIASGSLRGVATAVSFWVLLTFVAHVILSFGVRLDLAHTFSAMLRVLPAAFVISAAVAFTVRHFSFALDSDSQRWAAAYVFLISQFLLLAVALPQSLAQLAGAGARKRLAASITVVITVFAVNFVMMGNEAQAATPKSEAFEVAQVEENRPWWCWFRPTCPENPGDVTGGTQPSPPEPLQRLPSGMEPVTSSPPPPRSHSGESDEVYDGGIGWDVTRDQPPAPRDSDGSDDEAAVDP